MAVLVNIYFDPRPLEAFRSSFSANTILAASTRAASKSGGDAIRKVRVESGKIVKQRKKIRARNVAAGLPTSRSGSISSLASLEWRMRVSGRAVPVAAYPNARQTKKGVTVAINSGKRVLIKSAFIRTTRSGYTGVFLRAKNADSDKRIRNLLTSRISDVFRDSDVEPRIRKFAQMVFTSSFARLLPIELARLKR